MGEAPGYRGARISGIPFTSERQVSGAEPGEATATVVRRTLAGLGLEEDVLLCNVVPTHPGTSSANRTPSSAEIRGGLAFLGRLRSGRRTIAVGRVAEGLLGPPAVRHPAHGGARAFESGLVALLERGELA